MILTRLEFWAIVAIVLMVGIAVGWFTAGPL